MPRIFPALAAVLLLLSPAARAADAPAITVAQARAAVDQAADIIGKNYVFPEKRAAIVAKLKANEAAGRYDVTDPFELETRLSPDLSQAGGDKHLWIKFDPAQSESLRKPLDANHSNAFFVDRARRRNQGYVEMKVLPGNLRYVDLAGFEWSGAETVRIVADVARFMAGGDAVILDLRHNGGGSGEAVQALVSYFLPPDGRVLMTFHEGANGHAHSTHVLNKLAGPRMVAQAALCPDLRPYRFSRGRVRLSRPAISSRHAGRRDHGGRREQQHAASRRWRLRAQRVGGPPGASGERHQLGRRRRAARCRRAGRRRAR